MILYTLWSNILIIRIIIIIVNKKLNSIFDTESKIIHFMGSNKYIIRTIKCWPVFKQDPENSFFLSPALTHACTDKIRFRKIFLSTNCYNFFSFLHLKHNGEVNI